MRILIATSEAAPYAKTGGLADVTGSLIKEFRKKNKKVSLVVPLYSTIRDRFRLFRTGKSVNITMGGITKIGHIWISENSKNPRCYFIDCEDLYGRPELYGTSDGDYADNALRFIFFSRAVIEMCDVMGIRPDIIHCNDWQTALIPLYLKNTYRDNKNMSKTATLYTIHNFGYEGLFAPSEMKYTGLSWDYFTPERLEFYGRLNFMKAGILYSDLINTVSETYAQEILEKEYGFGLDGFLRKRQDVLYGVINGIDYAEWDPSQDSHIPHLYTKRNLSGKTKCKKVLLKETGLSDDKRPFLGVVSRLSAQKGLDLLYHSVEELISIGVNIIILGKGEDYYQRLFKEVSRNYRKRVCVRIGFNESFAHMIYAGSDFFLMPSRYEPCGLGQLIAMKYGTIPIARKTGGLVDSIKDYDHIGSSGTGFLFTDYTPSALQNAVKRALCVFTDKKRMKKMSADAMTVDFSWKASAEKYMSLYRKAVKKVRR